MRHPLFALTLVALAQATAWAAPPEASVAPAPETVAGAVARLQTGDVLPAKPGLKVTGAYFAYCAKIGECPPSRVLRIDKHPMMFQVYTKASEALRGKSVDFTWEILTADGDPVFDTTHAFELKFIPEQVSGLTFKRQPKQLRGLEPGRYRYRVSALTADGKYDSEWERVVVARK